MENPLAGAAHAVPPQAEIGPSAIAEASALSKRQAGFSAIVNGSFPLPLNL